jgi:AcrR family transcriptional regulator
MPSLPIPTASGRRLRQREEARRAILDAAQEILVAEGYDQFSMRKLAGRCGYTAPTIYHHFGDKLGLIDTLLELRTSELVHEMRTVPLGPEPLENVRALFAAFAHWGLANPTHYELLTAARQSDAEPIASGEEARELFDGPIRELDSQGRLPDGFEMARQAFWALLHGLVSLQRTRPDVEWCGELIDRALDGMINGLVQREAC